MLPIAQTPIELLYDFYRGGVGFALVFSGLVSWFEPQAIRVRRANAALCLAVGVSFCMSVLPPVGLLQIDVSNCIVAQIVFVIGYASYEMNLFLFGGQKSRGLARRVFRTGLVWTQVVWILPLLDWVLGMPVLAVNVEHGHGVGLFHLIGGNLIFSWIICASVCSVLHSRWRLSDMPLRARDSKYMLAAVYITAAIVACLIAAMVLGSRDLYRLGNVVLESFMVYWYFLMVRRPQVLARVRMEVGSNHRRKAVMLLDAAAIIRHRLESVVADGVFRRPGFDLPALAAAVRQPAYRLSAYFSQDLSCSFPVWLNKLRIEWVCMQLDLGTDEPIIELALASGYGSKSTFNKQFIRLKGLSPSEYRRRTEVAASCSIG